MGAKGAKPQYATPYGAYGPRVGQIPNPAFNRPPYQRPPQQPVYTHPAPAPAPVTYAAPVAPTYAAPQVAYAPAPVTYAAPAPAPVTYAAPAPAPVTYAAPAPVTYATPSYAPAAPTYLPSYAPAPTIAAPSAGAAFALDAADGVIDGRYFGSQVGVAAPSFGYGTPAYGFGAPTYTSYASPVASFPTPSYAPTYTGFGYTPSLAAPAFPTTSYASPATYASPYSFGSPYTAAPTLAAPSVAGAFALDAADGVIDGKYFGAQVGVTAPAAYGAPYGAIGAPYYGF